MLQQRVIPDEKLKVPPKASSVNIGAPRIQAPQLSKSDSPQVHIPLSTDNNKGSSPQSPPKITCIQRMKRHCKGKTKRTIIIPIRYTDVNSITNIISV